MQLYLLTYRRYSWSKELTQLWVVARNIGAAIDETKALLKKGSSSWEIHSVVWQHKIDRVQR